MSRAVIFALGCGLLSAVLYASALVGAAGSLLLVFLVQLPLFVCGLSKEEGWIGAALAGAAGTAAMVLAGGPWAAGNFALAEAAPAILLSQRAGLRRPRPDGSVEWYPAGGLILWLTLYALAVLGGFMLLYLAAEGGLEGELRRGLAALLASLELSISPEGQAVVDAFVAIMPGLAGATWLLITLGNATLAQALLQRFRRNLRPGPELASIAFPAWLGLLLGASALLALLGPGSLGFAGRNFCFVLTIPYFFSGLACIHVALTRWQSGPRPVVLIYIALALVVIILSWLAVMAIAAVGVLDQLCGLRRRLARPEDRLK